MLHFIYFFPTNASILNMLHTLCFSLQNAVYFIMLPFLVSCIIHILHTGCAKNLNVKLWCQKVKITIAVDNVYSVENAICAVE